MTRRRTLSSSLKPMAAAAIVALGLLAQLPSLDRATFSLCDCPVGTTSTAALNVLTSIVLTGLFEALQFCVLDYQQLLQGLCQALLSYWLLLFVIGGVALLRAALPVKANLDSRPANNPENNDTQHVDSTAPRSTR
jgi:hypothetical protein